MERRDMFRNVFAAALGVVGFSGVARAAPASQRLRVVYHLSDLDKVNFVLGNIQNHIQGVGGPDKIDVKLVVHGPALKAFHAISADQHMSQAAEKLMKEGVGMAACANTMKAQGVKLDDLLPGFGVAEKGGVVRLTELQVEGYHYLRP